MGIVHQFLGHMRSLNCLCKKKKKKGMSWNNWNNLKKKEKKKKRREKEKLTNARSLFRVRNTSCSFMVLKSAMLSGSSSGCSRALATYPAFLFWKSLIEESRRNGDPFSTKGGFQVWTLGRRSCPLSTMAPSVEDLVWATLAILAPF